MKLIRFASVLLSGAAYFSARGATDDSGVPIARIALAAPQSYVLAARSMTLTAIPYNSVDAALTGRALRFQVDNPALATVDNGGTLRGLAPGVVTITASDPDGAAQAQIAIYVYPAKFTVTLASSSIDAGASTTVSSQLSDADGNPINGTAINYSAADAAIATISGSTVTGAGEGRTVILANIDMGPGFEAYSTTAPIEVLRPADYKLTRLITTDTASTNVKLGVPYKMAAFGPWVASITSLSNGSQGLVLARPGQNPKIIDSAGNTIAGTTKVIDSFTNVAVNASGDVAAVLFTPSEWCEQMIVVYPAAAAWKPVIAIDTNNCNMDIQPRAVDSKGGFVYRAGADYLHWTPDSTITKLFSAGDSILGLKPLSQLNSWAYTPYGNLAFLWLDTSNTITAAAMDATGKYTRILGALEVVSGNTITDVQQPVEINAGEFLCRVGNNTWSAMARIKGAAKTTAAIAGQNGLGWIQTYYDGFGEDIYFHADANGGTSLWHLNGSTLTAIAKFALWREIGPVYAAAADTVFNHSNTGSAPLAIQQIKGSTATTLIGPGVSADGVAYLGLPQYALVQGASASAPILRTSGGFLMKWTASGLTPIVKPGDTLPGNGNRPFAYLGTFAANRKGDFVFTANTQISRSGLYAYRNGMLQVLAESDVTLGNQTFQYIFCCERSSSYLAINSKGQVAAAFGGSVSPYLYFFDSTAGAQPKIVAQMNAAAPGGGNYNCCPTVRIDEAGHVGFQSYINGSRGTFFLWDGSTVRRVVGNGDTDSLGRILSNANDIAGAVSGFYLNIYPPGFGNTMYSVDATGSVNPIIVPGSVSPTGVRVDGLFGPTFAANGSSDLFFPAYSAGGTAIFVRKADGSGKTVAISSRKTPDGDWLLTTFPGAATDTGDTFFGAYFWSAGKIRYGIFQASPK